MLLLTPSLQLPTGVISPAGLLSTMPPWQGSQSGYRINPQSYDILCAIEPWLMFLRQELRAGRPPFWNPYQFSGTPFWSNGQSAPLFPLNILFAFLPVQLGLNLLPWIKFVVAGAGTWALARELGLCSRSAALAAIIFPLSGLFVSFLDFPIGSAIALVPFLLWAVERLANGRGSWLSVGIIGALQLMSGHPETVIHTAMVSALYLFLRGASSQGEQPSVPTGPTAIIRVSIGLVGGWLLAATLSAIYVIPVLHSILESARWKQFSLGSEPELGLLLKLPFRLILPDLYGDPAAGTWWGPFDSLATAVYVGIAPIVLSVSGLLLSVRNRRWFAVSALLLLCLITAYHLPGPYYLLKSLPVLNRVLHHRLLFFVELGLALLAGAGCHRWLSGHGRSLGIGCLLLIAMFGIGWCIFEPNWATHELLSGQIAQIAGGTCIAILLTGSLSLSTRWRRRLWPVLLLLVATDLLLAHGKLVPGVPVQSFYPATGATEFLRQRAERTAGLGYSLRPNAAMVYSIRDLRGDDPVQLERFANAYSSLAPVKSLAFEPIANWSHPLLDLLAVRWVVAGPHEPAPIPNWRLAYCGQDARIYERQTALPVVRWQSNDIEISTASGPVPISVRKGEFSGDGLRIVEQVPGHWVIDWRSDRPARLVVAEVWDPGWHARIGSRTLPVELVDHLIMGVRLPAGQGRIIFEYRPPGFLLGMCISTGTALALLAYWIRKFFGSQKKNLST